MSGCFRGTGGWAVGNWRRSADRTCPGGCGLLIAAQMLAQLRGSADAATSGVFRQLVLDLQKTLPEVGPSRPVLAKHRVIAERVAKEPEAVEAAADRFGFVRMAGHTGDDRKVGIYGVADRYAVRRFDDAIIFLDPPRGLLGFEKSAGQRAEAGPGGG